MRSGRPHYLRPAHGYEHLAIGRRTVFRWLEIGDSCQDWPPFDAPAEIEKWWQRMRGLGLVKNSLPSKVAAAIEAVQSGKSEMEAPLAISAAPSGSLADKPATAGAGLALAAPVNAAGGAFDPMAEVKSFSARLVAIREARDAAYLAGNRDEGDRLDRQYSSQFTEYTVVAKRVSDQLEKSGALVSRAAVEADIAPRVVGIAVGGMFFFAQIQSQLAAAPDLAAQNAIWRSFWREKIGPLLQSRFVPEFLREMPEKLWADVLAFIESRRPPDLSLASE